jgi:microcystin-dependent protein
LAFYTDPADRSLAFWSNFAYAAISTVSAGAIGVSVDYIGSGTPHNNMPPYQVVNFIIKV